MDVFTRICLWPAGLTAPEVKAIAVKPSLNLLTLLRERLLNEREGFKLLLDMAPGPPLAVHWVAAGDTAGTALYSRCETTLTRSILLSGLDRDEDMLALSSATSNLVLPYGGTLAKEPARVRPPLLADVHRSATTVSNATIATVSVSLATTFFALLGLIDGRECQPGVGQPAEA